ncbi:MAG: CPBP family intramembrane metalloprotease [Anaerolineae bacterium]|nr:CPBP family intramembrane metalloprotease [Anaerolineae bacterium]
MNAVTLLPQTAHAGAAWKAAAQRAGLFTLLLICGLLVFVFGVDYHVRFWTNSSGAFKAGVSALFLVAMLALRRSAGGRAYWPVAFAFLAASLANVSTWYLAAPAQRWVLGLVGTTVTTPQGQMWGKAVDVVLKLAPIFVLLWLAHEGLGSVFIRRGKLGWSLGIGLLALFNFVATAIAVAASKGGDMTTLFANLPWWFTFALINAFMEEIWFRGLFLRRLEPVLGAGGALLLTTLAFGTSHLFATYIDLWGTLAFGVITCTLGLAWALLMHKTDTLWGSVVFHTAADVYGVVAIGF